MKELKVEKKLTVEYEEGLGTLYISYENKTFNIVENKEYQDFDLGKLYNVIVEIAEEKRMNFETDKIDYTECLYGRTHFSDITTLEDFLNGCYIPYKEPYGEWLKERNDECTSCKGGGCFHCEPHRFL